MLQRDRILRAMVEVVAERGYAGASVELVVAQAGVELMELVASALARQVAWQNRVLSVLASWLAFMDAAPQ